MSSNDDKYPEPEGWGDDGFWRDPAIDSDYETGLTSPVRPAPDGPREDPGYSYWADGRGWESSPGTGTGTGPRPGDATSLDATRGAYPPGGQPGVGQPGGGAGGNLPPAGDQTGYYGAGGGPTAVYPGPPVGPGGPGGPGGRGPGGPGGRGPGGPDRPGGPRGRRKGDWWRRWTWKKALAVVGSSFVLFVLALVGVYYYLYSSATIPAALSDALEQSSTVYYSNGTTVLGTISNEDRQDLTINQIPKSMQDAAIAAEDRSFWTEGGISPTGILRAAYDDLTSSGSLSSGSTITQEFVKNYYAGVGSQQTISRKMKEIFIAQKLSSEKSKDWILQNYLNVIPLGNNAFGVAAASETYFGIPVSKATVAQDAVIAAIIQEPSLYWELKYRPNLISRWHYVLDGMVTIGDLTQAQANSMKFPKLLTDSPSYTPPGIGQGCATTSTKPWAPYLMQQVCTELQDAKPVGANSSNAPDGDGLGMGELEDDGMKIVTTVSEPMEAEMYNAVNSNMAQLSAEGSEISPLPSWALIGAELQDPSNGQIVAEYPGRTQNMSAKQCAQYDCDDNTVTEAREQVGSSFKPYELSEAVQQGMDVQDSTLNSSTYLCIPPVSEPMEYSQAISAATYNLPGSADGCSSNTDFKVENDDGEIIGKAAGPKGDNIYGSPVQNALAQSSNTAFTDLAHRDGTDKVVQMAADYGVDVQSYASGGSGLTDDEGAVTQIALGGSAMTVNQQAQMLATIDDNGVYHEAHIIKYWQLPAGPEQTPYVPSHVVLTPALDSQVQYAMEETTVDGTGTDAAVDLGDRPIIGKTGTTSDEQAGFFIGAIPQYALVVGMFTSDPGATAPNSTTPLHSLSELGGGGFGGFWPAKIWNTFAQAEFNNLSVTSFQSPVFTGSAWNLLGPIPKAKPKKKKTPTKQCNPVKVHGRQSPATGPGCVTTTPTPPPTPTPTNTPTSIPTGLPTTTATATPTTSASPSTTPTSTVTPTPSNTPGLPFGADAAVTTESGVKAGLAVGGVLVTVLPGSLLWTSASRRRRKRRAGAGSARGTGPER